ncbi:heparinase II/III domain-containing protein [Paenibacillus donghaensis]|uniref:heparinase II/III domain-containing protein n=1 Tax=Paenibacillus donghaensis TaxID=414771 RepID=UPI001FE6016B|nr:heparinase II/III family protein [Paenibacillus donghaensis]
MFRNSYGSPGQSYFAIMSSPEPIAHGHLDQGSFILYKNSIPLVMDSGIEGYFDSSTSWHISSYSHACLQFATRQTAMPENKSGAINLSAGTYSLERGWVDVPRNSRVLDVKLSEEADSITIEINNPEEQGKHIRHVTYVKQADLYVIRDTVENFTGLVQFNLLVAAQRTEAEGSRLLSEGVYGVDLETIFLCPVQSIQVEKGRSTPFFDSGDTDKDVSLMDYIRAVADAKDGFLTILYPKERGQRKLQVKTDQAGSISLQAGDHCYRLEISSERYGVKLYQTVHQGEGKQ